MDLLSTVSLLNWYTYLVWTHPFSLALSAGSHSYFYFLMLLSVYLKIHIFEILSFTILVYFSLECSYISFLLWGYIECFLFIVWKKEVHRWALRSPEILWTFMQSLYMFICGENPSISKILRGFWETKEHKLLVWTVHSPHVSHIHRPTQLSQPWLLCPL